jgi:hypothetical protein
LQNSQPVKSLSRTKNARRYWRGNGRPASLRGLPDGAGLFYCWRIGCRSLTLPPRSGSAVAISTRGCSGFCRRVWWVWQKHAGRATGRGCAPMTGWIRTTGTWGDALEVWAQQRDDRHAAGCVLLACGCSRSHAWCATDTSASPCDLTPCWKWSWLWMHASAWKPSTRRVARIPCRYPYAGGPQRRWHHRTMRGEFAPSRGRLSPR